MFVDSYIAETRASAKSQLKAAQELSQSRHVLSDELSELSRDLVSVLSDEGGQPTLLEDLETLHRNLKELQSVKTYVQIVEHALNLRCDSQHIPSGTPSNSVSAKGHLKMFSRLSP